MPQKNFYAGGSRNPRNTGGSPEEVHARNEARKAAHEAALAAEKAAREAAEATPPVGTVDEVLAWVGDDAEKALAAHDAEEQTEAPREELLAALATVAAGDSGAEAAPVAEAVAEPAPEPVTEPVAEAAPEVVAEAAPETPAEEPTLAFLTDDEGTTA